MIINKWLIAIFICFAGTCYSASYIKETGQITKIRIGERATFYSLKTDDGRIYTGNSNWLQVAQHASRLKAAHNLGERIIVEFLPHANFPNDSIWKIKGIETALDLPNEPSVTVNAEKESPSSAHIINPSIASVSQSVGPNVLLIVSDDQGAGDFGFMGNEMVKTPHLDRLASESAVFRRFIVAPACSPTRASLMTGRHHMKTGVWGVGDRNNFLRDETIMPKFFKDAGYRTGYFGKRDGTYSVELEAWHRGCDEVTHVTGYKHQDPLTFTHKGAVERKGWTCDLDTAAALDFIERQGSDPWWVAVPYLLPHLPWIADSEFVQPYLDAGCSQELANVYGCITQMDAAIGNLLKGVERMGHADDTIVIFLSDNGPSYKGMTEEDIESRNPLGLQGSKAFAWENGIVVPMLAKWPGRIPPGERTQFATIEDLLPTVLDLAEIPQSVWPEHQPFDGISLRSAFENPSTPSVEREVFRVAISGPGQAGGGRWVVNDPQAVTIAEQHTVLIGPRFKLHNLPNGKFKLFDLQADVSETHDVGAVYPEVMERYIREMNRQYTEIQSTGRTYQMSRVKVGSPSHRYNRIEASLLKQTFGSIKRVSRRSIGGFTQPEDRAVYEFIVEDPGVYTLSVNGDNLDSGKGWTLSINGDSISLDDISNEKIEFGPVELPDNGLAELALSVEQQSHAGGRAVVNTIEFIQIQ